MSKEKYILIHAISLYRAESRYKNAYGYRGVAMRHAQTMNLKIHDEYVKELRTYNECVKLGHKYLPSRPVYDPATVMTEREYADKIRGMGQWKVGENGNKIWIAFDTPDCCDPTSEVYKCM